MGPSAGSRRHGEGISTCQRRSRRRARGLVRAVRVRARLAAGRRAGGRDLARPVDREQYYSRRRTARQPPGGSCTPWRPPAACTRGRGGGAFARAAVCEQEGLATGSLGLPDELTAAELASQEPAVEAIVARIVDELRPARAAAGPLRGGRRGDARAATAGAFAARSARTAGRYAGRAHRRGLPDYRRLRKRRAGTGRSAGRRGSRHARALVAPRLERSRRSAERATKTQSARNTERRRRALRASCACRGSRSNSCTASWPTRRWSPGSARAGRAARPFGRGDSCGRPVDRSAAGPPHGRRDHGHPGAKLAGTRPSWPPRPSCRSTGWSAVRRWPRETPRPVRPATRPPTPGSMRAAKN